MIYTSEYLYYIYRLVTLYVDKIFKYQQNNNFFLFIFHHKIEMNGPDHNRMNKQSEIEKKLKQIKYTKKWFVDCSTGYCIDFLA